jgi:acyl-coenzyme A thioesterase PaaI-like protein
VDPLVLLSAQGRAVGAELEMPAPEREQVSCSPPSTRRIAAAPLISSPSSGLRVGRRISVPCVSVSPRDVGSFDSDTALVPGEDGRLEGLIPEHWRAGGGPRGGPHGGYLASLMLRGLAMAIGDPSRAPLMLTVQFVSQPVVGPVALEATAERTGRSLTSVSGRLMQADSTVALALAAFATHMSGPEYDELPMPEVEGPWEDRRSLISEQAPQFVRNLVLQPRFGRPFQARDVPMVAGGWTGLHRRRPVDALALAVFSDAWFSPPYARLDRFVPSPTVTLSVYFRAQLPRPGAEDEDLSLTRFETRLVRDGCFQSDGVIWAPDGTVLAQSHQLQLLLAD